MSLMGKYTKNTHARSVLKKKYIGGLHRTSLEPNREGINRMGGIKFVSN